MKFRLYAIVALMVGMLTANAQDIHFSQFYASPLTLNPALTGNFNGFYRISGIYRNQFPGLSSNRPVFSTPSASVDLSLLREKIKKGALGVGIVFFNDQQNGKTFNQNQILVSLAYNMGFGPKNKIQLGLGLQGGLAMTKMDFSKFEFNDGFNSDLSYNSSHQRRSVEASRQRSLPQKAHAFDAEEGPRYCRHAYEGHRRRRHRADDDADRRRDRAPRRSRTHQQSPPPRGSRKAAPV